MRGWCASCGDDGSAASLIALSLYFFVEQDNCGGDPLDSLRISRQAVAAAAR
jgi:hypothetical protein